MAALTNAGYAHLRNTGPVDGWFLEIQDDQGTAIVRKASSSSDDAGSQTITLSATFDGTDPGDLPATADRVVAFAAGAGGDALTAAETFTPFTFGDTSDEVTVSLPVEVPEQA